MNNIKFFFKNLIHKLDNNAISQYLIKKNTIKTFPRYKIGNIAKKTRKVVGWVPYLKYHTEIIIFNFFSINYSIRKPISGKIFLVNKNQIIKEHQFLLLQDELKEINCKDVFQDLNGSSLIIQLESDQIKNFHGGHDGHLRFWGKYNNSKGDYCSITHSMPISFNDLFLAKDKNSRNYNFKNNQLKKINFYPGGKNDDDQDKSTYYGFNMILDQNNDPVSTWHLSPKNNSSEDNQKYFQGFYCPDIINIDPYIIIDNNETGLNNNKIDCYIMKNNQIEKKSKLEVNKKFVKKISEIFGENISPPYFFS